MREIQQDYDKVADHKADKHTNFCPAADKAEEMNGFCLTDTDSKKMTDTSVVTEDDSNKVTEHSSHRKNDVDT